MGRGRGLARLLAGALAAGLALMSGAVAAAASATRPEKLKVGYVHVFDEAPVLVAQEGGFFKKQGLDVALTAFDSGTTLVKGLVTGSLDIGILGFSNAFTWASQGAKLRIIGKVQDGYHALIVRKDSGIQRLSDLKGRTLASQAAGSTADIVLKGVVFPKGGLKPTDVNMVYTSPSTALASLLSGRVDAAFLFEPFDRMARLQGNVTELYEIGKDWPFPCMVIIATEEMIRERPDAVRRFLMANKESIAFMLSNKQQAARMLVPYFLAEGHLETPKGHIDGEQVVLQAINTQTFEWRITDHDLKRMRELKDIMAAQGYLRGPINLDDIIDLRFQRELERSK